MKPIAIYAVIYVLIIVILAIYGVAYFLGVDGVKAPLWGAEGGYIINILGVVLLVVGILLGWGAIKARQGGNR